MADITIQAPSPKFVMYNGDTEPKPLHPPKTNEVHFWTNSKGEHRILEDGVWTLVK
jgi:hypothetical protein